MRYISHLHLELIKKNDSTSCLEIENDNKIYETTGVSLIK